MGTQEAGIQFTGYQSTHRRPIADVFRGTAQGAVRLCIRWDIHPDAISYLSILAAALAAACFWGSQTYPVLLIVGPFFCYLRLWLNMLDGMVALASGKASRHGEILNDLPDRVSDLLIFVGVAHSGLAHPLTAYWAAIAALLTAYVGTLGQAIGAQREYSGVMSKPWRMLVLHAGAWMTLGFLWWGNGRIQFGAWTILDWTNLIVVIGCVQTIWLRLRRILRSLAEGPRSTFRG
jgi:phosphatidylglycerophosphate synthase